MGYIGNSEARHSNTIKEITIERNKKINSKYFIRICLYDNSKHNNFIKIFPDNIISEDEKDIYIRTIN